MANTDKKASNKDSAVFWRIFLDGSWTQTHFDLCAEEIELNNDGTLIATSNEISTAEIPGVLGYLQLDPARNVEHLAILRGAGKESV